MQFNFLFTPELPFYDFASSEDESGNFKNFLNKWWQNHVEDLSVTTRLRYKNVRACFHYLYHFQIQDIKSQHIDIWLEKLILAAEKKNKGKRQSFTYEISILKSVFQYYHDEVEFGKVDSPIRKRHYQRAKIPHKTKKSHSKDLTKEQFELFLKALAKQKGGDMYCVMAQIHYHQALRISEVAALFWEDIVIEEVNPSISSVTIQRSYKWIAKEGALLEAGFKNSKAHKSEAKTLPLFPETYAVIKKLKADRSKYKRPLSGLIFHQGDGTPFSYRMIQYAYDKAFSTAGLNFSGTHILRHGGSRHLYKKTRNLETAQQLLGNTNLKNTVIYTEIKGEALFSAVQKEWKQKK